MKSLIGIMNNMNPEVIIEVVRDITTNTKTKWKQVVEAQVKQYFVNNKRPFTRVAFKQALKDGPYWRLTLSGIDFKIKTIQ